MSRNDRINPPDDVIQNGRRDIYHNFAVRLGVNLCNEKGPEVSCKGDEFITRIFHIPWLPVAEPHPRFSWSPVLLRIWPACSKTIAYYHTPHSIIWRCPSTLWGIRWQSRSQRVLSCSSENLQWYGEILSYFTASSHRDRTESCYSMMKNLLGKM